MEPITLRAHHLDGFFKTRNLDNDSIALLLIEQGYVDNPYHPFVDHICDISRLLENPSQTINVVIGKPNIVCNYPCPKRQECPHVYPQKSKLARTAFFDAKETLTGIDKKIAEQCNVEQGRVYDARYVFSWFQSPKIRNL